MIESLDHVNIVTANLERAVRFYAGILGFSETRRAHLHGEWIESVVGLAGVSAQVVYMQPPSGPRIELIQYDAPQGRALEASRIPNTVGIRHLAFRVDDIHREYQRLQAEGVECIGPPMEVPGDAVRHEAGRKTLCYFRDPDGNILELAHYAG